MDTTTGAGATATIDEAGTSTAEPVPWPSGLTKAGELLLELELAGPVGNLLPCELKRK